MLSSIRSSCSCDKGNFARRNGDYTSEQCNNYTHDTGAFHAVDWIDQTVNGAASDGKTSDDVQYTYDDAGRMITRTEGSDTMTLEWDVASNLVSTTQTGGTAETLTYIYDAGGQRVARIGEASATAYFGETELTDADVTTSSALVATRHYSHAGSTVAYQVDNTDMWLMFGDIQGSASLAINKATYPASGSVVRNAYTPYGEIRGGDQLTGTDRGWLGQTEDHTTGLQYLNARYYDPTIGRFLSPGPLMNPGDPRTLDPYRYADNNPVVFTDATGLCPGCTPEEAKKYAQNFGKQTKSTAQMLAENAYAANAAKAAAAEAARRSGVAAANGYAGAMNAGGTPPSTPGRSGLQGIFEDIGAGAEGIGLGFVNDLAHQAIGTVDAGANFYENEVVPWWEEHGDVVLNVGAIALGVACIFASGGVATVGCIAGTLAMTGLTIWDGMENRGMTGGEAILIGAVTVVTLGAGALVLRGAGTLATPAGALTRAEAPLVARIVVGSKNTFVQALVSINACVGVEECNA